MLAIARLSAAVAVTLAGIGSLAANTPPPPLPEAGACWVSIVTEANLSIRQTGEPVSLAPDGHCAVGPNLVVGLVHSARALFEIDSGQGICLAGKDGGCPRPYDGGGLDLAYQLPGGQSARVWARARLVARSLAPFKPTLRLGALFALGRGRARLLGDPHIALGLANQDLGNRDIVAVPLRGQLAIAAGVTAELVTGIRGERILLDEKFAVPIGAALSWDMGPRWQLGATAAFSRLFGPQNSFKERHAAVWITYRSPSATPRLPAMSYTAD